MDTWLGNCMAVSASRNGFDHAASEVKMRGIRVPSAAGAELGGERLEQRYAACRV